MTGGSKLATTTTTTADSFWFKYVLSSLAAVCAETATYPLDLTKTRLQIQGEISGDGAIGARRGMVGTAVGIVQEEGVACLYQGLQPALIRHIVYTGSRMSIYELFREHILQREADGSFPVWKASVGGLCAGALGQLIASPTDLIKVQLQMEGRRKLEGKPPRVKGALDAFNKIVAESGVKGLYRGVIPNVQRAALVNMGDLCTYDTAKQNLLRHTDLQDNYVTHSLARVDCISFFLQWLFRSCCCNIWDTSRCCQNQNNEPANQKWKGFTVQRINGLPYKNSYKGRSDGTLQRIHTYLVKNGSLVSDFLVVL
ncbi:mitochondrial uncoupling protein 4 isoform X2 [Magallana gigas]|uniref:mitochondrial uncoupling protein 4 isoform X2 n=1 Tax=Magallana gigas TaxID=29159 RepID=UPI003341ECF1